MRINRRINYGPLVGGGAESVLLPESTRVENKSKNPGGYVFNLLKSELPVLISKNVKKKIFERLKGIYIRLDSSAGDGRETEGVFATMLAGDLSGKSAKSSTRTSRALESFL